MPRSDPQSAAGCSIAIAALVAAASCGVAAAPRGVPPEAPFRHPGVLVNRGQLDFLREKVKAGEQPWAGVFERMKREYGDLSWTPRPRPVVDCGPYSRPNNGCSQERNDAVAAYTHALLWYVTEQPAHAAKAREILDAWSASLTGHTGHNARLQAGWAAAVFVRGAEIIRHTGGGWPAAEVARFEKLLQQVFLPRVTQSAGGTNGNWDLVMTEAALQIGVFLDARPVFDQAVARWRRRVPAYFYLESDGPLPAAPPDAGKDSASVLLEYWHDQHRLVNGLSQETCRDLGHTGYGIASAISLAETAFQQGVDLYREQSDRLRAALEFHAGYLLEQPVPGWLCGGRLDRRLVPTWEIGLNHYGKRLGLPLPLSQRLVETRVRAHGGVNHHIVWESFTHAGVGWAGLR